MRNVRVSSRQLTTSMVEGRVDSEDFVAITNLINEAAARLLEMFTVAHLAPPQHTSPQYDYVYTGSVTMRLWVESARQSGTIYIKRYFFFVVQVLCVVSLLPAVFANSEGPDARPLLHGPHLQDPPAGGINNQK